MNSEYLAKVLDRRISARHTGWMDIRPQNWSGRARFGDRLNFYRMRSMIMRLLSGLICLHLVLGVASAEDTPEHNPPVWLDKVQTYCMMPILPESAVDLGISVNGVWGGVGSADPILRDHEPLRRHTTMTRWRMSRPLMMPAFLYRA